MNPICTPSFVPFGRAMCSDSQRQMSGIDVNSVIQRTLYIAILGPLHTMGNDNIYYYFDISLRGLSVIELHAFDLGNHLH